MFNLLLLIVRVDGFYHYLLIMEFLLTNRGSRQVAYEGYLYHKNKTLASGITYWECVQSSFHTRS